jgi:DNA-binding NarL/FixJ family response regulator
MNGQTKKVLIIDDHPVVCHGLQMLLKPSTGFSICGQADNIQDGLDLLRELVPDVLMTDISLNGRNGLDLIKEVRQFNPSVPILVFSIHGEDLYAERVLSAGANAYVMKQADPDILLKALNKVISGEIFLSEEMTNKMLRKISRTRNQERQAITSEAEKLSDRELEVFELIGQGFSTKKIAEHLNLSIKTIETYRLHIKEKLDLEDTAELSQHAVHWVEVESCAE